MCGLTLKNKVGVIPGRFAPLHKGHQLLIETAIKEMDNVIVIVYKTDDISIPVSRVLVG
ncbi:hypothetical protein FACS1894201_03140 [Bacteroidia bacterium]|nr:hypothetical protein FACS1894201_03140 [Bacteroidia bacterium]